MSLNQARAWAVLGGLLLWLSFPNPWALNFEAWTGWLAWVALVPLFMALRGQSSSQAFRLGLIFGLAFFAPGLFWLTHVHPLGPGAIPAWLSLALWCALFPALFSAALAWGQQRRWPLPLLWVPALWVLGEALRETALSGFPWISLGSSQVVNPALLPLAGALGLNGLHFAVAFINACLFAAAAHPRWAQGWARSLSALAMAVLLFGLTQQEAKDQAAWAARSKQGPLLKTAVIQGGIDMDQVWDQAFRSKVMERYLGLSRQAVAQGAQLLVWPESSFPGFFNEDAAEAQALKAFAHEKDVTLLLGSSQSLGGAYQNSAVLLRPSGQVDVYSKRHLVPFGEYVPFRQWSPLLDHALTRMGVAGFEPGPGPARFLVGPLSVAPLICYESVFPGLLAPALPADIVAVMTVDTWYGRSSGPVWHALQARLRAVESGACVARAATTGISLFAGQDGSSPRWVGLDESGLLIQEMGPARPTRAQVWGPKVLWFCLLLLLGTALWAKRGPKTGPSEGFS